ncbi:adaptor protein complex ap-3 small chain sigma3 [Anaeramoeba flamelloides]|uniref:AP complex subunit sigma n=1 Tax=Anaeramoeba flamelloides TaxID=1746091 RepID=A0AAV7ZQF0_9EUKA|nr:adaptor protein complex ap-3 small chain sigma3 [Anaeramoeba flamelloides]
MIFSVLIVNNRGKPRLIKFYVPIDEEKRLPLVGAIYDVVSQRSDKMCNFFDGNHIDNEELKKWGSDIKFIYRHFATLYFIFVVDGTEPELGMIDLIQIYVESLDQYFENVCELDLIFHTDKVHQILDQVISGGLILETEPQMILNRIQEQDDFAKKTKKESKKKNKKGRRK